MKALVFLLLLLISGCVEAQVPRAALEYRSDLIRNARAVMGMDAPIALFAAQVHQESAWRPDARSGVGAQGLAQFMPATADWISALYPELRSNRPYNPAWALRALVRYDAWIYQRVKAANTCQRWAMTLSSYNGGLGWVQRDQTLAQRNGLNRLYWFGHVETVNAGRSKANWQENRGYPKRIIYQHQPLYAKAGWGASVCL